MNVSEGATYSRTQRAIESVAVVLYGASVVALLAQVGPTCAARPHAVIGAVLVGYLAADLLSGVVHWLADTYGSPRTPIVGPTLIYGFREHHDQPDKILQHDFVETNGAAAAAVLPVTLIALALPGAGSAMPFLKTALATLTLAIVATNQLHQWAHMAHVPAGVAVLQRLRLVLRPEEHARHHTAPFRTHYCITTGWLNGPLARLGLFAKVERILAALAKRERLPSARRVR